MKGWLGFEKGDLKEMRVRNRIARLSDSGLLYEPDPRHVEVCARALRLDGLEAKPPAAPGHKQPFFETVVDAPADEMQELINMVACKIAAYGHTKSLLEIMTLLTAVLRGTFQSLIGTVLLALLGPVLSYPFLLSVTASPAFLHRNSLLSVATGGADVHTTNDHRSFVMFSWSGRNGEY